ncbi:MAG: aspartate--tRNA(Asn) ligase [Candidatus Geothermarchaeales archaeon]
MGIRHLLKHPPDSDVIAEGWIQDKRPVGDILFLTVRDQDEVIQLVVRKGQNPRLWKVADEVPRQSVVRVSGTLRERNGRLEISPERLEVLGRARHPLPLDPTGRTPTTLPVVLDARPLSLRMPTVAAIFRIRSVLSRLTDEFFHERGFVEVHSPKIIASATEGGAELFEAGYFGGKAFLAQSPQLYKEQLMLGFNQVYELAQYWRAEKSHTTRHLTEFMSVDVELAYADYEAVMGLLQDYVGAVTDGLREVAARQFEVLETKIPECNEPFPRITYDECLEELVGFSGETEWGEDLGSEALELLSHLHPSFFFIYDWPAVAKPFYIGRKAGDPERSESFDLMHGKIEIASGGTRVNDPEELRRRLVGQGLNPADFEHHLSTFQQGMPPHAGWAVGFDRFLQVLTRQENIRDVVLYPRDPERLAP